MSSTFPRRATGRVHVPGPVWVLEADLRRQVPGARLVLEAIRDEWDDNRFERTVAIEASAYAQALPNGLLLVRPPRTSRPMLSTFPATARASPIMLAPREERDVFVLQLAPGIGVDEMPDPVMLDASFASFSVRWQVQDGRVARELTLQVARSMLPAARYDEVRAFLEAFRDAERSPIVLVRP